MKADQPRFELEVDQARAIAQAAARQAGVAELSAGTYGEVSLLYPGERIAGLRRPELRNEEYIEINVVVDLSQQVPVPDVAQHVRNAAFGACPQLRRVDVIVADAV